MNGPTDADGNVSTIPLPGDLSSMISGIGVFYPNRAPTYQNKSLAQRDGQLKRDNRIRLTLSLAILSGPFILRNMAMSQSNVTQGPQDPDTKVSIIMDEILRRGEQQRGQVKMSTWVPPTEEDLDKIRKIGHDAIPTLDKALDSPQPNRPFLAVKLLEVIGGPDIVPPLKKALRPSNPNLVRIASLSALRSAPDTLRYPSFAARFMIRTLLCPIAPQGY
jgi:hypothetical protein